MTLSLQIEQALAEAGLGALARAAEQLDRLLEKHAPGEGPLTLGALHEARARVAMLAGDEQTSRKHFTELDLRYRGSGIPSLVARCETFGRELRQQFRAGEQPALPGAGDLVLPMVSSGVTQEGITQIERALSDVALPREERCARALALLAEHTGLALAGLWLLKAGQGERVASTGELPEALDAWVDERLLESQGDNVTHTDFDGPQAGVEPNQLLLGAQSYRLFEVTHVVDGLEQMLGAVVFAEQPGRRAFVSADLLRAVAGKLTTPTTVRLSEGVIDG
jgi:hypothetical protein